MDGADKLLEVLSAASIRATLIVALVWLVLLLLQIQSGAIRHRAWTLVLLTMLLMPVMPKWLPAFPVSIPERIQLSRSSAIVTSAPTAPVREPGRPVPAPAAASSYSTPGAIAPVVTPSASQPTHWPGIAVGLWAGVALLMLAQVLVGWLQARNLASRGRSAREDSRVFTSAEVASPVVIGILAPRILTPVAWHDWPEDVRRAVLMHEGAHARRRDGLISLLARLNRCVYWFHPLAWYLERRIAVHAEEACDDEVVRGTADPVRYAEVLVDMAARVRARGHRASWHAVGMAGPKVLGARIDRVLSGEAWRTSSPARSRLALTLCGLFVVSGLACQQQIAPLREDPDLAASLKNQRERNQVAAAARALSLDEANRLAAAFEKNPDDLDTAAKLLIFYRESGQKLMGWNEMVAARRSLLLRLIERHPESELVYWPLPQRLDPEGWTRARDLWMKHLEPAGASAKIMSRAVSFFAISEKPMAESILLRAERTNPGGPQPRVEGNVYYSPWIAQLGQLYARAIVGSDDDTLFNVVRSVSLAEANGPFAAAARKKLAETDDPLLLRSAGTYLWRNAGGRDGLVGDQQVKLGFDHRQLGQSYLDRAMALDPDSEATKQLAAAREHDADWAAMMEILRSKVGPDWHSAPTDRFASLSDSERLDVFPLMGDHAYMAAENAENSAKDRARFDAQVARARWFAEQSLAAAERNASDPRAAAAKYEAHVILGVVALRAGDRNEAVGQLEAAARAVTPNAFDAFEDRYPSLQSRLTNYLLKDGERESVAGFFESASKVAGRQAAEFSEAAAAIRDGRMPRGFQYMMTPR